MEEPSVETDTVQEEIGNEDQADTEVVEEVSGEGEDGEKGKNIDILRFFWLKGL